MAPGARKNLLKLGGILTMTRSFFLSICGFWGDFWPLVDFQGDMRRQHFWEPANDGRRPARPASGASGVRKKHRRLQDGVLWHKNPWTLASPELGNRSTYHSCHWMLNMFLGFLRILSNMSFWCHFFFLVIYSQLLTCVIQQLFYMPLHKLLQRTRCRPEN